MNRKEFKLILSRLQTKVVLSSKNYFMIIELNEIFEYFIPVCLEYVDSPPT